MNQQLQNQCKLFAENRKQMKEAFPWGSDLMSLAGSTMYTALGLNVNGNKLKECETIFRENTGAFSDFRSNVKIPLLCKMALSDNPLGYFKQVEAVYRMLNTRKLIGSEYKIIAAMTICDHKGAEQSEYYVERTNEIYMKMKEAHKWLTSDEDIPFAAMLAVSDMDVRTLAAETEACYEYCKDTFTDRNARQTLSHVLALSDKPVEEKCGRTSAIWNRLHEEKHRFASGFEIAVLGTLGELDLSVEDIVQEIIDADEWLKKQKGFGNFTMGEYRRRMFAALLVMQTHRPENTASSEAVIGSSLMLVIQMEICMMLLMTAVMVSTTTT